MKIEPYKWSLMTNNITKDAVRFLIHHLESSDRFTQGPMVEKFEQEWSKWLGVEHSVFVNSGSSANFITFHTLKALYPQIRTLVCSPLGWVSDYAAMLNAGFELSFVDISPSTLGIDNNTCLNNVTSDSAILAIHIQGFNCLTEQLVDVLREKSIPLIEDSCESHGARFGSRKVGAIGLASNFSFYFAHHLSTIEGGMICTNNKEFAEYATMYRSHGMVRELKDTISKERLIKANPLCHPEFIFEVPGFNMRSTELNACLGLAQLKDLDEWINARRSNFLLFMQNLNPLKYRTDFDTATSSNYAFNLVLKEPDAELWQKVIAFFEASSIEYRRGSSGGGNQLRQPYLRRIYGDLYKQFPETEHVHNFALYFGNFPSLHSDQIISLCESLNNLEM